MMLLVQQHEKQPEGYVYVFVPSARYDHMQRPHQQNRWATLHRKCPVNNIKRQFETILKRASIESGEFHDLRRMCLTRWFQNGLSEFDVRKLADHSDFETNHRFYLTVRRDLLVKARMAAATAMSDDFGAHLAHVPSGRRKTFDSQCKKLLHYRHLRLMRP